MLSDDQDTNPLTEAMTSASSRPPRLLKNRGDETVVYDTALGDTQYLKQLTLALYLTCRDHTDYTPAELAFALAARLDVAATPKIQVQTDDTLASLRKIGLLEFA